MSQGSLNKAIVADIGGTNARFSCVDLDLFTLSHIAVYPCSEFTDLADAVKFYQYEHDLLSVKQAAIAVASLVAGDVVTMTNLPWKFSINELKNRLEMSDIQVLNDFVAQAMSLPFLADHEKIQIGQGKVHLGYSRVILGAGTGLGVAYLVPTEHGMIPVASEGGHIEWSPQTDQEWFIKRFLAKQYHHVSVERLLSGPGLENLYVALAAYHHQSVDCISAAEITERALNKTCAIAIATVQQFFASLGSFSADLVFSVNALSGVYLAGGIVPKLLPLIADSEFRTRLETKMRYSSFSQQTVVTYVVGAQWPGLIGAAGYLKQRMKRKEHDFA